MTTNILKSMVYGFSRIINDNINNKEFDVEKNIEVFMDRYDISKDIATISFLISAYHSISATDNYIIVATDKDNNYFYSNYTMKNLVDFDCFNLSYDSHNKSTSLRLKVSNELKKDILKNGIRLSTKENATFYKKLLNLNNGQLSEYLVKTYFNIPYHKDNLPFYYSGDMEINNKSYQIKSHKATFCNIEQIKKYIVKYGMNKQTEKK